MRRPISSGARSAGHILASAATASTASASVRLGHIPGRFHSRFLFQGSVAQGTVGAWIQGAGMTTYMVGLKLEMRSKVLTIEAEDALVAALKIKLENPEALITYVRKSNQRGDRRHPHEAMQNKKTA
jgi:hypothetical protein